jgi:mutator protein MutT
LVRRIYPEYPLIGVGALIVEKDKVLLVKRASEPGFGLWSIPGGVLKVGETLEEALIREVEEETGIKVKVQNLLDVLDLIIKDENGRVKYHYVLVDYLAKPLNGSIRPSSETPEVRWIKIEDVEKYPITRTLRRLLRKLKGGEVSC